jgi:hypothetical protein
MSTVKLAVGPPQSGESPTVGECPTPLNASFGSVFSAHRLDKSHPWLPTYLLFLPLVSMLQLSSSGRNLRSRESFRNVSRTWITAFFKQCSKPRNQATLELRPQLSCPAQTAESPTRWRSRCFPTRSRGTTARSLHIPSLRWCRKRQAAKET